MDNRPSALFNADISEGVGKPFGPTLSGEILVMDEVVPEGAKFRAYYRYMTSNDFERITRDAATAAGSPEASRD